MVLLDLNAIAWAFVGIGVAILLINPRLPDLGDEGHRVIAYIGLGFIVAGFGALIVLAPPCQGDSRDCYSR
jgi:hypothetical protein